MNQPGLLAVRVYRLLLFLYPLAFRDEFGAEMQAVFSQAIEERSGKGITEPIVFCLRELKDLPGSLYKQHWMEAQKEGSHMNAIPENNHNNQQASTYPEHLPGSWGAAVLAGLPHLLMGLLIAADKFLTLSGNKQFLQNVFASFAQVHFVSNILGISLVLLVAIILFFAWRRSWPLWSASWYGYGFLFLMGIVSLIISELDIQESWLYTNAAILIWLVVWATAYLYLFFRDRLRALLTIFFLFPLLGVMLLEFISNPIEGWLAISLGLLTALTAGTIVRLGSYRVTLGLVIGVNLVAVLTLAYIRNYKMTDLPSSIPPHWPDISSFLELLAFYTIIALILIGTPFLIQGLVNFGRRKLLS